MQDKRLLICDDEPAFGRFDAYDSFEPTTIVLDMIMPGMDGNELVLWLPKRKCTARVIIITGYTPDYANHAKILAEFKGTWTSGDITRTGRD